MPASSARTRRRPFPARLARAAPEIVLQAALGLLIVSACTPASSVERGFGSRQVLAARDPAPGLRSFSADATALYLAHPIAGVMAGNGITPPYDRTLLDFATGAETPIASGVIAASLLPGAPGQARSLVMTRFPSSDAIPPVIQTLSTVRLTATFFDEGTGQQVDVSDLFTASASDDAFPLLGATRADQISVVRALPNSQPTAWIGPPENLVALAPGYTGIEGRDRLGFIGNVVAPDGKTSWFQRFPFDGSAHVEVVPAMLGEHVVPDVDGVVEPADPSTGVVPGNATSGMICPLTWTSATPPPCLLLYDRTFSDRSTRAFVRILDDAREVELPGMAGGTSIYDTAVSPTGRSFFWSSPTGTGDLRIFSWNVDSPTAASCTVPGVPDATKVTAMTVTAWANQGDGFAIVGEVQDQAGRTQSWTLVAGSVGQPCRTIAADVTHVNQVVFSPDDTSLARLETDPDGMSAVHLTSSDGSADRVVAAGSSFFQIDFLDDHRLLLWHANTDGYSLSWLDLDGAPGGGPVPEHPIADRVEWPTRASWVWLNARWLLIGDSVSAEDGTFSVSLIDSLNGKENVISRGVTDFRVPWTTPPPDATDLPVAYVVRGRTASGQDGVWVAHLPLADFPPGP